MKLVTTRTLVDVGATPEWLRAKARILSDVTSAVATVEWPVGSASFTIYPESGKKPGQGNGVVPIKKGFVQRLVSLGWKPEQNYARAKDKEADLRPGNFDVWLEPAEPGVLPFVVEWETGNVSSSHRSLNKMAEGLRTSRLSGGILIVPTRALARFLTDRIGNYEELECYFGFWASVPTTFGYFGIMAVEHDATSPLVPRISKMTDGRALR